MYTFVNATCTGTSTGSQWKLVDISNSLVFDIFTKYSAVFLELNNNFLPNNVYVDLFSLRTLYSSFGGTLNELLVSIGNATLPAVPELPSTSIKYAKYSDAIRAGYKVTPTVAGIEVPANYPRSEMKDVLVSRPGYDTDVSLLHSHCLVSVNGYFHLTDVYRNQLMVYNGDITRRISQDNHVGILSFLDIGAVSKEPIDPLTVMPGTPGNPLRTGTYFRSKIDLTNKSVMLVLAGNLIFPGTDVFYQVSADTLAINFESINILEKYFEAYKRIDLSSLGLERDPRNVEMINVDNFYSDNTIRKFLALSQTFLVVVDTPKLITNKISLKKSNIPGIFTAYQNPVYPLFVGNGRMVEYWKTYEDGFYSVTAVDTYKRNYVYPYVPARMLNNITDQKLPFKPFDYSGGFMLEIGAYT